MNLHIEVESTDRALVSHVMGTGSVAVGQVAELPGGGSIEYRGAMSQKSFDRPEVSEFLLHLAEDVGKGLLAAWLYDKLQGDRTEVNLNKVRLSA